MRYTHIGLFSNGTPFLGLSPLGFPLNQPPKEQKTTILSKMVLSNTISLSLIAFPFWIPFKPAKDLLKRTHTQLATNSAHFNPQDASDSTDMSPHVGPTLGFRRLPPNTRHTEPYTTARNTTQHNTTQHNTTQHNTTQHNTTQQCKCKCKYKSKYKYKCKSMQTQMQTQTQTQTQTQRNATQCNAVQCNAMQHTTTQYKTHTHTQINNTTHNTRDTGRAHFTHTDREIQAVSAFQEDSCVARQSKFFLDWPRTICKFFASSVPGPPGMQGAHFGEKIPMHFREFPLVLCNAG